MTPQEALMNLESALSDYRLAAEKEGFSEEDIRSDIDDALYNAKLSQFEIFTK